MRKCWPRLVELRRLGAELRRRFVRRTQQGARAVVLLPGDATRTTHRRHAAPRFRAWRAVVDAATHAAHARRNEDLETALAALKEEKAAFAARAVEAESEVRAMEV
eukprot:gene46000-64792_t